MIGICSIDGDRTIRVDRQPVAAIVIDPPGAVYGDCLGGGGVAVIDVNAVPAIAVTVKVTHRHRAAGQDFQPVAGCCQNYPPRLLLGWSLIQYLYRLN